MNDEVLKYDVFIKFENCSESIFVGTFEFIDEVVEFIRDQVKVWWQHDVLDKVHEISIMPTKLSMERGENV